MMIREHWMRIILVIASIMIIVGVGIMAWVWLWSDRDVIVVKLDGDPQMVGFERLGLIPGEECEYTIELKSRLAEENVVRLRFVEREKKTLPEYAYIKIMVGDRVICDERMADVFEGEDIQLPVNFSSGEGTELRIVYYLPLDVGNEAKNAEALFDLWLSVDGE
jgi:hypothetical protein